MVQSGRMFTFEMKSQFVLLLLSGIFIIAGVLILIIGKYASALSSLIIVPIIGALIAGFGEETAGFAITGIKNIAPVAAMFVFAILFFGILTDAGMFDPIIRSVLQFAGQDPVKIVISAALLSMLVHLDGSGAVTFLIVIPAMLPLFDKLKLDRRILACVAGLGAGTMNLVPWGGPTLRAASALQVPVTELYKPLIIPQVTGLLFVFLVAFYLGKKEVKRLVLQSSVVIDPQFRQTSPRLARSALPEKFWINILLTLVTITLLILDFLAPALIFMLALVIVLNLNYPSLRDQAERLDAHARSAMMMASLLMAAGVFIGILTESGMIRAMAEAATGILSPSFARHIPLSIALTGMPLSLVFDPDSFYFGILPVVAEVGVSFGIPAASVGQAALLGQMTTGFPLSPLTTSTFLLVGLCRIDLADHQRFSFLFAFLTTLVMTVTSLIIGLFPI